MMLKYKILPLIWLLILPGYSSIQAEEEVVAVKTYISQDGVHPGGVIDVALLLDILPGWHVNGPELADQFLVACALMIVKNDNIEVLEFYYPDPDTRVYNFSEVELQIYEGKVVLGVRVRVDDTAPQGENILKASFLYQACDEMSCLAPKTLEFAIPFQVVPVSKEIKKINQEIFTQLQFQKEGK